MTDQPLDRISEQLGGEAAGRGNPGSPPLHLWHPEFSGDIDIRIERDGSWWHEGERIRRASLVRLFASILRREADGDYYLVTPVEKWRIQVEGFPLQVVDFDVAENDTAGRIITVITNTGQRYLLGRDYPLFLPESNPSLDVGEVPAVGLDHGLAASFSRPAWYRLVEAAEQRDGNTGVESDGLFFPIARA